jgi:hypothetical protein
LIFFVHPGVHLRTRSFEYLLELLPSDQVRTFHDHSWKDDPDFPRVTVIIFFQIFPELTDARVLRGKRVTLVPMWDAVQSLQDVHWWEYGQFKLVSFCEALTKKLLAMGVDVFPVKFFPPVQAQATIAGQELLRIFFWRRTHRPDLTTVTEVLPQDVPIELLYRSDIDDSPPPVPPNVKLHSMPWFSSRSQYLAQVSSCDLYVAPRESEGIGLSFLEALACGVPVLAIDAPTMNEYIRHGENGFFFGRCDGSLTRKVIRSARPEVLARAALLRGEYERKIPELLEYLLDKPTATSTGRHPWLQAAIRLKQIARPLKAATRRIAGSR